MKTSCLTWTSRIDSYTFGPNVDPLIAGKTIKELVSSQKSARSNGALCWHCHNRPERTFRVSDASDVWPGQDFDAFLTRA